VLTCIKTKHLGRDLNKKMLEGYLHTNKLKITGVVSEQKARVQLHHSCPSLSLLYPFAKKPSDIAVTPKAEFLGKVAKMSLKYPNIWSHLQRSNPLLICDTPSKPIPLLTPPLQHPPLLICAPPSEHPLPQPPPVHDAIVMKEAQPIQPNPVPPSEHPPPLQPTQPNPVPPSEHPPLQRPPVQRAIVLKEFQPTQLNPVQPIEPPPLQPPPPKHALQLAIGTADPTLRLLLTEFKILEEKQEATAINHLQKECNTCMRALDDSK